MVKTTTKPAPETSVDQQVKFLTREEVLKLVGVSYPCLWGWIRAGLFPPSRVLGIEGGHRSKICWVEAEVRMWMANRPQRLPKGTTAVWQPPSEDTAR